MQLKYLQKLSQTPSHEQSAKNRMFEYDFLKHITLKTRSLHTLLMHLKYLQKLSQTPSHEQSAKNRMFEYMASLNISKFPMNWKNPYSTVSLEWLMVMKFHFFPFTFLQTKWFLNLSKLSFESCNLQVVCSSSVERKSISIFLIKWIYLI